MNSRFVLKWRCPQVAALGRVEVLKGCIANPQSGLKTLVLYLPWILCVFRGCCSRLSPLNLVIWIQQRIATHGSTWSLSVSWLESSPKCLFLLQHFWAWTSSMAVVTHWVISMSLSFAQHPLKSWSIHSIPALTITPSGHSENSPSVNSWFYKVIGCCVLLPADTRVKSCSCW